MQLQAIRLGFRLGAKKKPTTKNSRFRATVLLVAASYLSVGIYNSDGELVRTIYNSRRQPAGSINIDWDGRNDAGVQLTATGTYRLKAVANPVAGGMRATWERPIGNTSVATGSTVNNAAHFLTDGVWEGTRFHYGPGYSEGMAQCYLYAERGDLSARKVIGFHREHSIMYICGDGKYVYRAGLHSGSCFITATDSTNGDRDVAFQFGLQLNIANSVYYAIDLDGGGDNVTGLAVQQFGNYLFAAHGFSADNDHIRVLDKKTGKLLRSWPLAGAHNIKLANDNTLWAVVNGKVRKFSLDADGVGTDTGVLALADRLTDPTALAVSPSGELAIIDGTRNNDPTTSARHQVHFCDALTGAPGRAKLGRTDGYDTDTLVYNDKFFFANMKDLYSDAYGTSKPFLCYNAQGELCVGDTGCSRVQLFDANLVYQTQLAYLGYFYACQVDPNNPERVFSNHDEYRVNLDGSYVYLRNWAAKVKMAYDDQQNRMRDVATLSNGHTYCLAQSQDRSNSSLPLQFVELTGTGLRYTGVFTPNVFYRLNSDGTLWTLKGKGDLGVAHGWYSSKLTFDANHNPVIGPEKFEAGTPPLGEFDPISRDGQLWRNQKTSNNIVAAFSKDLPDIKTDLGFGYGFHLGGVRAGTNKWLWRTSHASLRKARGGYSLNGAYPIGNRVQNVGTFMQAFDNFIAWGDKGEYYDNAQVNMHHVFIDYGLQVLQFGAVNSSSSPLPDAPYGLSSNATTGTWVKIGKDYYLYHCDEGFHAAVHRWHVTGADQLKEYDLPLTLVEVTPPVQQNLLDGIAYDQRIPTNLPGVRRVPDVDAPSVNNGDTFPARIASGVYARDERVDVLVESHPQSSAGQQVYVQFDIKRSGALSAGWSLVGNAGWLNPFDNADDFTGLRIVDAAGKIILQVNRREIAFPDDYRFMVNGKSAGVLPVADWNMLMRYVADLRVDCANSGQLTVKFADFDAFATGVFEAGADWSRPAYVELRAGSKTNREGGIHTDQLDFYPVAPPAAPATPTTPTANSTYANSTTRSYPAASTYTYETTPLVVRTSVAAFNTGANSYTIRGRFFNVAGPEGWLADVYMPGGEQILFDRCVFATPTNGDMAHVTDDSRVRFTNCIFLGTGNQPVGTLRARAIFAERGRRIGAENCYFGNTAGCKLNNWSNNVTSDADTVTWRYNRYDNIMGGDSRSGGPYCQALQLQHIIRPGIEVAYNFVKNAPGASRVEDSWNWGESGGTAASPMRFHHNYTDGAFPANPTDGGFTGTGMTTDAGSASVPASLQPQYIVAEYNYFVRCMNACMNIAAGHHITYQYNTLVVCGRGPNGEVYNGVNNAVAIFKGQAYNDEQFDYNQIVNNTIIVNQANGENPYFVTKDTTNIGPNSKRLTAGNTLNTYRLDATFADEEAVLDAFKALLTKEKIEVGVLS